MLFLSQNHVISVATKVVDARIVDPSFKEEFNPDKMKTAYPSYNTRAGEQTFVWVSRFKHSIYSVR